MERMRIEIGSLLVRGAVVHAYARASAQDADIQLTVRFACSTSASLSELHRKARDEVLRYLDPA